MRKIDNTLCNEAFGKFIREAREKKGLYQDDMAKKLGISQVQYSHYERGARNIDLSVALNICLILGLDFNEFIKTQF